MSKFTGNLAVHYQDNDEGRFATLLEPLIWDCDEEGSGLTVTVPAGFASDGATVPRLFWGFLPPWGDKGTRAAVLHDYLLKMFDAGWAIPGIYTKDDAHWQLYLALKALGVPDWRARVTYWAVLLNWCGEVAVGKLHRIQT